MKTNRSEDASADAFRTAVLIRGGFPTPLLSDIWPVKLFHGRRELQLGWFRPLSQLLK